MNSPETHRYDSCRHGSPSETVAAASGAEYIDRPLNVSDVSGEVPLADLLTDDELAQLPEQIARHRLSIDETLDTTTLDFCCGTCSMSYCSCDCCELKYGIC